MFAVFAFPLALDVSVCFWSIYAFDRQFVFPREVDEFFPSWLNHILHTNIAVFILVEMIILHRKYLSRKEGIIGLIVFVFSYVAWLHVTRVYAGRWPYPILETLNLPSKIVFFAITMSCPILMYFIGERLNAKIWNQVRMSEMLKFNKVQSNLQLNKVQLP